MRQENPLFLLTGLASEYVLAPFAKYLIHSGFEMHEIDFALGPTRWEHYAERAESLVLITSAHPYLTVEMAKRFLPIYARKYPYVPSPLQMMSKLQPAVSVLVPHDLVSPINEAPLNEYTSLPAFDFYCDPNPQPSLFSGRRGGCEILDCGWIKSLDDRATLPDVEPRKVLLLPSMLEHLRHRYGERGFVEYFSPILTKDMTVKLPDWHGVSALEDIFRQRGDVQIAAASSPLLPLIRMHEVIVTNGTSSAFMEAAIAGKPVIGLLDTEAFPTIQHQLASIPSHPLISYHDYRQKKPIDWPSLRINGFQQMKEFDTEKLLSAILRKLGGRPCDGPRQSR
jgi:hypothetical protein